jgi:threonine synthase
MRREASPVSSTLTNHATSATPSEATANLAGAPASPRTPSRFGYATHLVCRECGHTCALGSTHVCDQCFGPLEVAYDLPPLTREVIERGPLSMWRYASLLPVPPDVASRPNLDPVLE